MCIENNLSADVLEKWKNLINFCKLYYIDSLPTGISDEDYDILEKRAILEDNFFVRDYVYQTYLKGTKTKNSYIEKIKKKKIEGITMMESLENKEKELNSTIYCTLKYDGCSLAIYINPLTGIPMRVVTVGNLNINDYGVDQTWKLIKFLPKRFPLGIVAVQGEALIDLNRLPDPDTARQKANGLINSKYCEDEVNNLLTIRAYRFYLDPDNSNNNVFNLLSSSNYDYRNILKSFETVRSLTDGRILFAPADVWTIRELKSMAGYTETLKTKTSTGYFLNDGWVVYNKSGICEGALKFPGAGSGTESIKTDVIGIQWNSQLSKGKDSWSANILINPIQINGCVIKKPSAGSVGKMVKNKITPGAIVSIIMANSTIPMVGETFKEGNGDFQWPTCSCGYKMSEKDVYGSLLKCGNELCSERIQRMENYINSLSNIFLDLDLNKFLVIDRFKWEETSIDKSILLNLVELEKFDEYYSYLDSFLSTPLQKRNLKLVVRASYTVLRKTYEKLSGI